MEYLDAILRWVGGRCGLAGLLLLLLEGPAWAQQHCLLVPVPLPERLAAASWVVEAGADAPQVLRDAQGHLLTRYRLTVFKVFRGPVGAGLPAAVLLAGGTLGDQCEAVSNVPHLAAGEQGVFFLEADPGHTGEWRLYAGPQGLIRYDLTRHSAAEPFARYPAIETGLYAALRDPAQPGGYRLVQPNAALAAPVPARRPGALIVIAGFSPTVATVGTATVLTILGSNFGDLQGTGTVQFPNADDGGTSRVRPLASDYLRWTDTEIQVRVPSATMEGSPAGSGTVMVMNAADQIATSSAALFIPYGIINLSSGTPPAAVRPKLINDNGTGGYTLSLAPSFQLGTAPNQAARAAFERANAQWACTTGANRSITTTATAPARPTANDGVNLVTFDVTPATLPTGVLGVTYSYYSICRTSATVPEVDVVFANRTDWNFGDHPLAGNEFDFESVVLHELGHGIQLTHVINPRAVMHYGVANGQIRRTLGTTDDLPGGLDEVQFSTTANTTACGPAPGPLQPLPLGSCVALPVAVAAGPDAGLALYPNPAADQLQVRGPAQAGRLIFYDAAGRQVARFELLPGAANVELTHLRPGLYQVEWTDGRTVRRGRLQKL